MCARGKIKEGKEVLEGAAVLAGGAKEGPPEEGTSEQTLEGGEGSESWGSTFQAEGTASSEVLRDARNVSRLTRRPEWVEQDD